MLTDKWIKFLLENLEDARGFQQMYQHGNVKIPKLYSNEMLRAISEALQDESISDFTTELEEGYWWSFKGNFDKAADVGLYWEYVDGGNMTIDAEPDDDSAPYIGLYLNEGKTYSWEKIHKKLQPLNGKHGMHVLKKTSDEKLIAWVSLRDSVHFEWLLQDSKIRESVQKHVLVLMKAVSAALK